MNGISKPCPDRAMRFLLIVLAAAALGLGACRRPSPPAVAAACQANPNVVGIHDGQICGTVGIGAFPGGAESRVWSYKAAGTYWVLQDSAEGGFVASDEIYSDSKCEFWQKNIRYELNWLQEKCAGN